MRPGDRMVFAVFGGLGNQMFQYAAGLYAERLWNIPVEFHFFETASGQPPSSRPLMLNEFEIKKKIQILGRIRRALYYGDRLHAAIPWLQGCLGVSIIRESTPHSVDSILFSKPKGRSLYYGYWQARSYLESVGETLREEFRLRRRLSTDAEMLVERIGTEAFPVAVHVRRGDYLGIRGGSQVLPGKYYRDAMSAFREKSGKVRFFVFSDDPDWVNSNELFKEEDVVIYRGNQRFAHEELVLMSSCKHHVIANSTFSWWGAWLNKEPKKEIVMPPYWSPGERVPKELELG